MSPDDKLLALVCAMVAGDMARGILDRDRGEYWHAAAAILAAEPKGDGDGN